MGSLNKVMLIGRLGKDPEIRYTQSGNAVANFTIATSEVWNDQQGQRQERTEWHSIVAWNRLADLAQNYLKQGKLVYIEGRLQTRSWDDQQTGQKRYKTEVDARTIQFLDSRTEGSAGNAGYQPPQQAARPAAPPQGAPPQYQQPAAPAYGPPQTPPAHNAGPQGGHEPPGSDSYIEDDIPF